MGSRLRRAGVWAAGAAIAAGLAAGCGGAGPTVACENETTGEQAVFRGPYAIGDCLARFPTPGQVRVARAGPGGYTYRAGQRLELTTGFRLEGAGSGRTTLFAARDNDLVRVPFVSLLLVRGAGVRVAGITLDGDCTGSPRPLRACRRDFHAWYALVVACAFGRERPDDCDVDGLVVDDVRVLHTKFPFFASDVSQRTPEEPGLFSNFLDFAWTIRRFAVAPDPPFGHGAVFHLGNRSRFDDPRGPAEARGPGKGVGPGPGGARRRYVVDLVDTRIRTTLGAFGPLRLEGRRIRPPPESAGQKAALLAAHVDDDDVDLVVNVRRARWTANGRLVTLGSSLGPDAGGDDGRLTFNCIDSELVSDHAGGCPRFAAALTLEPEGRAGGSHRTRVNLVRCALRVVDSTCPDPVALDTGPLAASEVCVEDSPLEPGMRGAGRRVDAGAGGCLGPHAR